MLRCFFTFTYWFLRLFLRTPRTLGSLQWSLLLSAPSPSTTPLCGWWVESDTRKKALWNSCEMLRQRKEMRTSPCNCIQAYVTACKLMELHESSGNCMQAYWPACKLMDLQSHGSACILEHSGTFLYYIKSCEKRQNFNLMMDGRTDRQDIRTCWAASSQLQSIFNLINPPVFYYNQHRCQH